MCVQAAALEGGKRFGDVTAYIKEAEIANDATSKAFGLSANARQMTKVETVQLMQCRAEFGGGQYSEFDPMKGGFMTPRGGTYLDAKSPEAEWFICLPKTLVKHWDGLIRCFFASKHLC